MKVDTFTAIESATGDRITGVLLDNAGRYSVGSSVVSGTDIVGGHWTYTVTSVSNANSTFTPSYNGYVYDETYFDAALNQTVNTGFGYAGYNQGISPKTNYSGNNGLGSGGDIVTINGTTYAVDSGRYVAPRPMHRDSFTAVESVTGDTITGVVFDDLNRYTVGSSVVSGPDSLGGTWTYTVNTVDLAAASYGLAYDNHVYDLTYHDVQLNSTFNTYYGTNGYVNGVDPLGTNYSGANGLGTAGDLVIIDGVTLAIDSGHYVVPVMKLDTFTAVESVTGDRITGVVLDNANRYSVGSSVISATDDRGGHWTYTVTSVAAASSAFTPSYNGYVYDLNYYDADLNATFNTSNGYTGYAAGVSPKTNFSGTNGLGSGGDLITIAGTLYGIDSGHYVAPKLMHLDTFTAVESVTGDRITGVLFDNADRYTVGSSVTSGIDTAGGHWTYTVNSVAAAPASYGVAYDNHVYDLTYFDTELGSTFATTYGTAGYTNGINPLTVNFSGTNGLGSGGDLITVAGTQYGIDSGKYVMPRSVKSVSFTAVESKTGDKITGVLFDNTGRYSVGSSVTSGLDTAGGTWTYTVTAVAAAASNFTPAYNGYVYDLTYFDASTNTTANTFYGSNGYTNGVSPLTTNYSGKGGLGSGGDLVTIAGTQYAIDGGRVLPSLMSQDTFTAVESKTGDKIQGVVFDSGSRYSVGSSVTSAVTDTAGGTWTYTVTGISVAPSTYGAAYNGYVYDTRYFDANLGTWFNTFFGYNGYVNGVSPLTDNYSGTNWLGSGGDLVTINGTMYGIDSGKYVVPQAASFTVASGGTAEIKSASSQSVTFASSTGTLILDTSVAFTGHVSGVAGSDALDMVDIAFHTGMQATFTGNTSGGTLSVTDGTHSAAITLVGDYTHSGWTVTNDGAGGTRVVDPPLDGPATGTGTPIETSPMATTATTFGRGSGQEQIVVEPAKLGAGGELQLDANVAGNELWLSRTAGGVASATGSDLEIDILGSSDRLTLAGLFNQAPAAQITAIDGSILDTGLQQLVQAMATYSGSHAGFDPTAVAQPPTDPALQTAIAAAWHH